MDVWNSVHDDAEGMPANYPFDSEEAALEPTMPVPEKDPTSQGQSPIQNQGTGMSPELTELKKGIAALQTDGDAMPSVSGTDYDALTADARRAAWSMALVQLGAGIAGNNMQAGLRNAGISASRGMTEARRIAMRGKEMEMRESEASFNRTAKKLGLDIDMARIDSWASKNLNDNNRDRYNSMKLAIESLTKDLTNYTSFSEEERKQKKEERDKLQVQLIEMATSNWNNLKGT